jgi:hypothetical protein
VSGSALRLCGIGNSHLAAVRSGWDICGSEHVGLHPTWFGAMRNGMSKVRRLDGSLRATSKAVEDTFAWTSGGRTEIVAADYDAFLLVGLGFSFTSLARLYRGYRTIYQSQALKKRHFISRAVFEEASTGLVRGSLGMALARVLRRMTTCPILLVADPLPSEAALHGKEAELWRHLAIDPDGMALFDLFNAQAERECAAAGLSFVPQPLATRAALPLTKDELRRGAVRMNPAGDTPFDGEDVGHMGPGYGVEVLGAVAARLTTEYLQQGCHVG